MAMSISSTLWRARNELVRAFHLSIIHGMLDCWGRSPKPEEPDFVASLVKTTTPLIYDTLQSVLSPRFSVSVCSVFCHQKPTVLFDQGKRCEIGDVLFVYSHTKKNGSAIRNAILFQAKLSAKQPAKVRTSDINQLHLYNSWPNFEYVRSGSLNGQKRIVTPHSAHPGAQYLLIDNRPSSNHMSGLLGFSDTFPIGCCMPDDELWIHNHLANELFDLLIFRTGRGFNDITNPGKNHNWSQVVWDILDVGIKSRFNRKNSGRRNERRISDDKQWMFFAERSTSHSGKIVEQIIGSDRISNFYSRDNGMPFNGINDSDDDSGASIVLIETSEHDEEES